MPTAIRFTMLTLATALVAAFLVATPAEARSKAPLGYQLMCLKTPAECKGGGASSVKATGEVMDTLKRVNLSVNRAIKPRSDRGDTWTVNASYGDCEDYVLMKRRQLIKAGVPASALRIAYVKTRSGEGHAILVVNTGKGKFVLDNLTNVIRPLSQAPYRIVSMQGADPRSWS
jgi:predicted transglutaminase-like cysteine proteinase